MLFTNICSIIVNIYHSPTQSIIGVVVHPGRTAGRLYQRNYGRPQLWTWLHWLLPLIAGLSWHHKDYHLQQLTQGMLSLDVMLYTAVDVSLYTHKYTAWCHFICWGMLYVVALVTIRCLLLLSCQITRLVTKWLLSCLWTFVIYIVSITDKARSTQWKGTHCITKQLQFEVLFALCLAIVLQWPWFNGSYYILRFSASPLVLVLLLDASCEHEGLSAVNWCLKPHIVWSINVWPPNLQNNVHFPETLLKLLCLSWDTVLIGMSEGVQTDICHYLGFFWISDKPFPESCVPKYTLAQIPTFSELQNFHCFPKWFVMSDSTLLLSSRIKVSLLSSIVLCTSEIWMQSTSIMLSQNIIAPKLLFITCTCTGMLDISCAFLYWGWQLHI